MIEKKLDISCFEVLAVLDRYSAKNAGSVFVSNEYGYGTLLLIGFCCVGYKGLGDTEA
jgi:hypothetical protein